ncbi:TetR family transcriptional regulator [Fructilactobacillus vespulae]|uniref:TetR family transcriptional regulator n=1 Tax=Fructilactobacillus vespulae TaxID=1249630 RepID=UPI0039B63F07
MADLRKQRTNLLIFTSFAKLLCQKPFSKITVAEIVSTAMIHRNTFYQHFVDKYELLRFFINKVIQDSDFSIEDFKKAPFSTINDALVREQTQIFRAQDDDIEFNRIARDTFVRSFITKNNDNYDIIWEFGTLASILAWSDVSGANLTFFNDANLLDEIYRTKKFPQKNIRK